MASHLGTQPGLFSDSDGLPLLVLSLKPKWHQRFVEATKAFEYRRKFYDGPFVAAVYVSGNVLALAALAEFGAPITGSPYDLAQLAEEADELPSKGLTEYFAGAPRPMALPMVRYRPMTKIPLDEIRASVPGFQPPQSYSFLERNPRLLDVINSHPDWRAELIEWTHREP